MSGRRDSFEELVCQLARREPSFEGEEFRRVEGAGGDGGVEAYWVKSNGKIVGYQAKYFLSTKEIGWTQIDESVEQALITHAGLERFVVAIPCDLTDKSGKLRKGKTGWEHWAARVLKWEKLAKDLGHQKVEFEIWSKHELTNRLTKPEAAGLREFWFGDVEFTNSWFENHIDEALAALDERYHPEDHVSVSMEKLFHGVARGRQVRETIQNAIARIKDAIFIHPQTHDEGNEGLINLIRDFQQSHAEITAMGKIEDFNLDRNLSTDEWIGICDNFSSKASQLSQFLSDIQHAEKDYPGKYFYYTTREKVDRYYRDARELSDYLKSAYLKAEKTRIAFVKGAAGSGKSHLMAKMAADSIEQKKPVILLLGQQLNNDEIWKQIASLLGLYGRGPDVLLGALQASAEAANCRCLLLVDAINEGPGSKYWRRQISSFLRKISKYPFIGVVISCRTEYFEVSIPKGTSEDAVVVEISGFRSSEEQREAARVFLDRRGIARPSTPWLAPEFINPLFLRTICTSLERENKSELPSGLQGSKKILRYYLESVERNIAYFESSTGCLLGNVVNSTQAIANRMHELKSDYLTLSDATQVVCESFKGIAALSERSWLDLLLANGLLRRDPSPNAANDDPLVIDEDVVRFSFQRFQDSLIGQSLMSSVSSSSELFCENEGVLNFILDGSEVSWQWRGLLNSLMTLVPEQFGEELIDLLPSPNRGRLRRWYLVEAFKESVKWREKSAFTERTFELLEGLSDPLTLLVELSVSVDHPWNARFLHSNLIGKKLAERDAFWTVWLNDQGDDHDDPVGQLIDWCLNGQMQNTNRGNQILSGVFLCWCFTASNRRIRDRATKALTSLFLSRIDLFPELLSEFANVNDVYILERLILSAYASCCKDPVEDRMVTYSEGVYSSIFKDGCPPLSLILRDAGLGIVERCKSLNLLPSSIDFERCCPPYSSKKVRFSVTKELIERVAEKAGGKQILWSAASSFGDFASYEISPRLRNFVAVSLDKPAPYSQRQLRDGFEDEVISVSEERAAAFEQLRMCSTRRLDWEWGDSGPKVKKLTEAETRAWLKKLKSAEQALVELLTNEEVERYKTDVRPDLLHLKSRKERNDPPTFKLDGAQRWVAKRAYDFGWTDKRFPSDKGDGGRTSRARPLVERIGKKYQWIALDELLCRLADNYWMTGEYGSAPVKYRFSTDVEFDRDIDPTIIEETIKLPDFEDEKYLWVSEPRVHVDEVLEEDLKEWPFEVDPSQNLKNLPSRTDVRGNKWYVLFEHQSVRLKYEDSRGEHGARNEEFRFLFSLILKKSDLKSFIEKCRLDEILDVSDLQPPEFIDGPFLLEAPWRATWPNEKWTKYDRRLFSNLDVAFPVSEYCWESHLDASLPDGARVYLPSSWFSKDLGLQPDKENIGTWCDNAGNQVITQLSASEGGSIVLINARNFETLLDVNGLSCVWLLVSERNAWPNGSNDQAAWRRSEGVFWQENGRERVESWYRDTRNDRQQ